MTEVKYKSGNEETLRDVWCDGRGHRELPENWTGKTRFNVKTENEEEEVVCEPCEPRVMKAPTTPSAEEVETHYATGHPTFKSWCPHSVRGGGESAPQTRDRKTRQGNTKNMR